MTLIKEILETLSFDELGLILRSQSDERFQERMEYFVRDSNTRCKCWYEGIYLLMSITCEKACIGAERGKESLGVARRGDVGTKMFLLVASPRAYI